MLTEAQLAERRTGIGGSDIAAIMGKSPYATPRDIWLLKRDLAEVPESEPMYWGSMLESAIACRYMAGERCKGCFLTAPGILRHPDYDWCLGTPDRLVHRIPKTDGTGGALLRGLEIKTASAFASRDWDDGVPEHYAMQCQWYMFVCGLESWDVAVLIGGQDYREFEIARDDGLIDEMFGAALRFWFEHVVAGVAPPCSSPAECAAAAGEDDGTRLWAGRELEDIVIAYYRAGLALYGAQVRCDTLRVQIQEAIGQHAAIEGPWGTITWRADKRGRRTFRTCWNTDWIEENT